MTFSVGGNDKSGWCIALPRCISLFLPFHSLWLHRRISYRHSKSAARPVDSILGLRRPRFRGVFAPVGIFKMPSATLSRENHGRWRPFQISNGRASRNVQPPRHNVFGFFVDAVFVHITNYTPSGVIQTKRMTLKVQDFRVILIRYSRAESNRNRRNRNPKFYPLNYGSISYVLPRRQALSRPRDCKYSNFFRVY